MKLPLWFGILLAAGWIYWQVIQQNKKAINEERYDDVADPKKTVFVTFYSVIILGFMIAIILWFISLFID